MRETTRDPLGRVFSAVADPTRRAILASLRRRPATISVLAEPFDISFSAVSKHVIALERAGLLRREIVGREHHCHLIARPLEEAADWLERYRGFRESRLAAPEARGLEARRPKRRQPKRSHRV